MKTEEILYNFLKTRLDDGNPIIFNPKADKASFELLAAKDNDNDNPIVNRITEQVISEMCARLRPADAALTLTLPAPYMAVPVTFITAIVLAAYLRGIEMGAAAKTDAASIDELEKLFNLES